ECADQHRRLSRAVDGPAVLDESGRQPTAGDTADVGNQVDRDQRWTNGGELEPVLVAQKVWYPVKIEPPDRIGQILANRKCRRLPVRGQLSPRYSDRRRIGRIAVNVVQLRWGYFRMLLGS